MAKFKVEKTDKIDRELFKITYEDNGKTKTRITPQALDVVKVLIYNRDRDAFVLTKQIRAFLYINHPDAATRVELCGGREDKEGLTSEQIAIEEVLEETGYKVDTLEKITTLYTTAKMTLFYVEVDDSMQVNSGGGLDYEDIDILYLPTKDAKEFMFNENISKRPGLMFALCWWFNLRGDK